MVHGFSDHCNNFNLFFPLLAARGVEVFGFDQRGFGRSVKSKRQRGLTGPTSQIMADISSVIRRFLPSFPAQSATRPDHVPLFLTGHSMGGGEVIYHASKFPSSEIRGYLSMSPWITLSPGMAPSRLEVAAGRIAMRIMPHFQVVQPVKGDLLSHDPKVSENARFDELCHDTFTLEAADGCLSRGEEISSGKCVVRTADGVTSFWLGHGTEDGICAYSGAKHWFENYCEVDDKELKTYDGWFHVSECLTDLSIIVTCARTYPL